VSEISRRAAVKIAAVSAAGLVGIAGSVVTPAQAQHAVATIGAIFRSFAIFKTPGGHSSIPFGYRIVAKPDGVAAARLPTSVESQMPARVQ
jgi:hypothetical protein